MTDFPKNYDPGAAEDTWYARWEESGYFKPEVNPEGEPYSIVIPPPNVTGQLHMGHALNATVQDVLARAYRMKGRRVLWLPGMDHAGIATQNVVERELAKEGTDRHTIGREAFVARVWQWKEQYGGRIVHQLRRIGASCDWDRERFTMDEGLSRAVREVFVRLYEEGLIYRATRLINWCPRCRTALSDLEVEHEPREGTLTYIDYPLADRSGHITVATTRPETMLGDTGVAVNPEDERYAPLIGKYVKLPLADRLIPIVADAAVDPAFGTGAVKVTPAHDFSDEAIARRQDPHLPAITVIGEDGRMTEAVPERFRGLDRTECRARVVEELKAEGLVRKVEAHSHAVGTCYRCRTVIEPQATPQWYVKVAPLAEQAMAAVREKRIRIVPEAWENSYFGWMENIQDWCITRQIWWGHRVPVWYCLECGETFVARTAPTACTACKSTRIDQDEDVLDTWFSSALWPFSTLGWPDDKDDLRAFYPTSVLVTAFDILFFWVARMIMMGLKFRDGEVPFRDVYIHAIVRDSEGQKMSKSKGNVVDPLVMVDKYGADAFRFTLAAFAAQGRDIRFDEARVEGYRHFINKLWNATRFILMNVEGGVTYPSAEEIGRELAGSDEGASLAERWILSRTCETVRAVDAAIDGYHFNDAAGAVYQFAWREFCDWYIELAKVEMSDRSRKTLLYCLDRILRLLHPFMPFFSEDLWQRLPMRRETPSIMIAAWPASAAPRDSGAEAAMAVVMDAVSGVRNIRGEFNVSPREEVEVHIKTFDDRARAAIEAHLIYITTLARVRVAALGPDTAKPARANTAVGVGFESFVVLAALDVESELRRLGKDLEKIEADLERTGKKLMNPDFVDRAPEAVVQKEREKFEELKARKAKIDEGIARLRE